MTTIGMEPRKVERGFLVLVSVSLGLLALGIFLAVGLIQMRFTSLGELPAEGALGRIVQGLLAAFGFAPSLYGCLLCALWGGAAFVGGSLRGPLRRLLATFLFVLCLAMFLAVLGGDGGAFGRRFGGRLAAALGGGPAGALLALSSLAGLLLSTNWFFYRTFARLAAGGGALVPEAGLRPEEEDLLAGHRRSQTLGGAASSAGAAGAEDARPAGATGGFGAKGARASPPAAAPPSSPGQAQTQESARLEPKPRERRRRRPGRELLLDSLLEDARRRLQEARAEEEAEAARRAAAEAADPIGELEDEAVLDDAAAALERKLGGGEPAALSPAGPARPDEGEAPARSHEETPAEDADQAGARHGEPRTTRPAVEIPRPAEGPAGSARGGAPAAAGPGGGQAPPASARPPRPENAGAQGPDEDTPAAPPPASPGGAPAGSGAGSPPEDSEEPVVEIRAAPRRAAKPRQEALFPEEPAPDPERLDLAAQVVLTARRPTVSLLQRRLGIGYADARQILEVLARLGAVERPAGAGPWRPLIDLAEWEARRR